MDMSELKFDEAHTWIRDEGKEVVIGITSYAQDQLGNVIFVELPDPGVSIEKEEPFGSVESAKAVEDLVAPLTGKVTRRNDELTDMPEVVNEDCYGEGWLIAVAPSDATDLDKLMTFEEYKKHLDVLDVDDSGDEDDDGDDDDLFFFDDE